LRELRDPEKSDEIQRFCSYWWIATPPDIVRAGELPETWGHIEVTAKCKVLKQAPKLDAQPLSPEFVAAILRNAAENQQQHVANAAWKAREEQRALASPERAEELQRKLTESQCLIDGLKRQLERAKEPEQRLTEVVRNFEREVGLPEGTVINEHRWYLDESVRNGRLWRAAQLLADGDVEKLRLKLQAAADALGALRQEVAAE
jgi:hypothetical protein